MAVPLAQLVGAAGLTMRHLLRPGLKRWHLGVRQLQDWRLRAALAQAECLPQSRGVVMVA